MSGYDRLVEILRQLRAPDGCPWDRKQTFDSLCPHIAEEAYELIDAIHQRSEKGMRPVMEEAGDLAMQVAFIGCLAEEQHDFDNRQIMEQVVDKLIRRHPHVFGKEKANDEQQALQNWETVKSAERKAKGEGGLLSGVPRSLPPLVKAFRISEKAASVGFDWKQGDQQSVFEKIYEELDEVKEAEKAKDREQLINELGDVLFAVVNLIRRYDVDPELALSRTNLKFMHRFQRMEQLAQQQDLNFLSLTDQDWEQLYQQVKDEEQTQKP